MATKTYYAKIDSYSAPANTEHIAGEQWKNLCDFMTYLSGSDLVTLVSWNSGANALTGSFENRTYPEDNFAFGRGTHALWRINTSSTRNWEWYLYAQVVSGSAAVGNETFNQPILNYGSSNFANDFSARGVLMQAAVCFSGSDSFNPWNGSISQGNSTAANPRWVSGSNDRIMYVLPRSNDLGGSHATSRNNSVIMFFRSSGGTRSRYNMIFDGDAFVFLVNEDSANNNLPLYVGPFELRNSLTSSGICNSPYGFAMQYGYGVNVPILTTLFGNTAGNTFDPQGGIAVPLSTMVSGSKGGIADITQTFNSITYQPNYFTEKYDEFPVMIGVNESPDFGLLGQFNYGLYRTVLGANSDDVNSDLSRAIIGSGNTTTINSFKISVPWTGSLAPGTSFSRTGSNYTWIKDYG
jgi:hypothetical protein